jgi:hypothetical protein
MLRIDCSRDETGVVIKVSGRLDAAHLAELRRVLDHDAACHRQLDLADVSLVAREVIGYLRRCTGSGVVLVNCPGYILEWIAAEDDAGA